MQVMKVNEILKLNHNAVVTAFKGKVLSTELRREWKKGDDSSTFENVLVQDSTGDKIWIVLKDRPPIGKAKGRSITILAHNGKKGISGLYAIDNEFKGKKTRQLKVTATGELLVGVGAQQNESSDPESEVPHSEANGEEDFEPIKPANEGLPAPVIDIESTKRVEKPSANKAIQQMDVFYAKRANAMIHAFNATVYVVKECARRHPEAPMSDRAITATLLALYNSGCYRDGLYDALPTKLEE